MSGIAGVIFDCDGVLFESREANLAYYNRIFDRFNYPPVSEADRDAAHICHTASSPQVLAALMKDEDLQSALEFAATLDYRQFIPYMRPEPNLREVLQQLAKDYPLAIATNRGTSVVPILQHFELAEYFSVIVTSKDVSRPKPAPDMVLLAAERLQVEGQRCLFIGDSELDQQAAEAAGVRFAGYGGLAAGELSLQNHLQLLDFLPAA